MTARDSIIQAITLLLLRIAFGARLIYGVIDNVLSWERMLEFESFLSANGFPMPLLSAVLSVYLQLLAGISWIVGYHVRLFSALMAGNFMVAIVGVHLLHGDNYLNTAPAIHLLVVAFALFAFGPGAYSLDQKSERLR